MRERERERGREREREREIEREREREESATERVVGKRKLYSPESDDTVCSQDNREFLQSLEMKLPQN